jgi:hypothetical protein
MVGVHAVAEAADGLVRVTVDDGQISELSLKPAAMRLSHTALAEHILAALRQALEDASQQVAARLAAQLDGAGARASFDRARGELDRISSDVAQQMDDLYARLNRLVGGDR